MNSIRVLGFLPVVGFVSLVSLGTQAVHAAGLDVIVTDSSGELVINAVVTLTNSEGTSSELIVNDITASATGLLTPMAQHDQAFIPDILPIHVGTRVTFPNQDDRQHHVFSFSRPKQFEMRLNAGSTGEGILFDVAGVVTVGCNIHDHMVGHIYVSSTPLFAASDEQGLAQFTDLAPGTYTLKLWHQRMNGDEDNYSQTVTILEDVDRREDAQIRLKPQRNDRRRRRY
jgi:plastocyanin